MLYGVFTILAHASSHSRYNCLLAKPIFHNLNENHSIRLFVALFFNLSIYSIVIQFTKHTHYFFKCLSMSFCSFFGECARMYVFVNVSKLKFSESALEQRLPKNNGKILRCFCSLYVVFYVDGR